jgi:hypothetical protein
MSEVKAGHHYGVDFLLVLEDELEYSDQAVYYAWQSLLLELIPSRIQLSYKTLVTLRTIRVDVGMEVGFHAGASSQ